MDKLNPYILQPFQAEILPGMEMGSQLFLKAAEPVDKDKRFTSTPEN